MIIIFKLLLSFKVAKVSLIRPFSGKQATTLGKFTMGEAASWTGKVLDRHLL